MTTAAGAPICRSSRRALRIPSRSPMKPILNAAACISHDDAGKCSAARVYIGGGVGEWPVRAISVEAALAGQALTVETCKEVAYLAISDVDPLSDHRASAEYRRGMAIVLVERALRLAINRRG